MTETIAKTQCEKTKKLRRKIEHHLRTSTSELEMLSVARLLGVESKK